MGRPPLFAALSLIMETILMLIGYDPDMFNPFIGKDNEGLIVLCVLAIIIGFALRYACKWDDLTAL